MSLNTECFEDRCNAVIEQQARCIDRCHYLQEGLCASECTLAIHHDGINAVISDVADGSHEEIALRVQRAGSAGRTHASLHGLPEALEINGVSLQFSLGAVEASSAQDEAETCWQFKAVQDAAHFAALIFVFHLAAHADFVHLRHHHQQSAGNGDIACERWTLGADALLEDLHDDFLAALECFLNRRTIAACNLLANALGALLAGEVLRMQIADMEEAVLAFAEVDERRLDGGFNIHDASLIDVAYVGGGVLALGEDLLKTSFLKHRDAALFTRDIVDHDQLAALGTSWCALLGFLLATTATAAAAALGAVIARVSGGFRAFGVFGVFGTVIVA